MSKAEDKLPQYMFVAVFNGLCRYVLALALFWLPEGVNLNGILWNTAVVSHIV